MYSRKKQSYGIDYYFPFCPFFRTPLTLTQDQKKVGPCGPTISLGEGIVLKPIPGTKTAAVRSETILARFLLQYSSVLLAHKFLHSFHGQRYCMNNTIKLI
jgi:hypothetical protein